MPSPEELKVILDCTSSPAKLSVIRDLFIANRIHSQEAKDDFGEMGMIIDDLVHEWVVKHIPGN